jgi:segregation and condensation protein B
MTEQSSTFSSQNDNIKFIEALLFVASVPVSINQLAEVLAIKPAEIEVCISQLEKNYQEDRGIRLQRYSGKFQLTTAPEAASYIEKFLGLEATARLSHAALEALVIIAYRHPITRPGIDAIRGVNSDGVLKSLLNKGLIEEVGRVEGPGRPILYGITSDFLQHFGFSSLDELPPLEEPQPSVESKELFKD